MIYICYTYLNQSQHQSLLEQHANSFPPAFRKRLFRFRRWQDQQASLLGRILLKNSVKQVYKRKFPKIIFGAYGKPSFEASDIQFNISHSHHLVICAITKKNKIGIDVEYQKPIDIQDFKFQMTDKEWQWISTAEDSKITFYEYWTKKEAVIKGVGKGFSADLKSFEILAGKKQVFFEAINWKFKTLQIDKDYTCHLASEEMKKVELHELQETMSNR